MLSLAFVFPAEVIQLYFFKRQPYILLKVKASLTKRFYHKIQKKE